MILIFSNFHHRRNNTMTTTHFQAITLAGQDAAKFLQGQLTVNVDTLSKAYQACAISDLKGRVRFGLWVARTSDDTFTLITGADCMEDLVAHINKYGVFSKFTTTKPIAIYPAIIDNLPTFDDNPSCADFDAWASLSIKTGNYWITTFTQGLFQPQELRLHQRGGVDYDKGCYLGQEIIARLYFKASPKVYLHRVLLTANTLDNTTNTVISGEKIGKVHIVNGIAVDGGYDCLVIGTPTDVAQAGQLLDLPKPLTGGVSRG
ncbi:YgfZ/GcvT domain-containing protein [Moraxella haemolytica]|uniref:CAF17-like 4Fe-4S cluster assembly/insertion protein YgfZ n=1 Tax=Moraxella haemolytica TaxID=2904119 RepID=UPI003AABF828